MNFGVALALLKSGKRLAREGWNGKGVFIYLVGPGRYAPTTRAGGIIAREQPDGLVPYLPYIAMKTVDGMVVPWLASQTDILAEDWRLAAGEKIDIDDIESAGVELELEAEAEAGEAGHKASGESDDDQDGLSLEEKFEVFVIDLMQLLKPRDR